MILWHKDQYDLYCSKNKGDCMKKLLCFTLLILLGSMLFSVYMENIAMQIKQPNGELINCFASGDEYFNYLHDKDGYTIIQSQTDGYFYYAELKNGKLTTSNYMVNTIDPKTTNLTVKALISQNEYLQKRNQYAVRNERSAPSTGTCNNITIMIRFSDQTEFETPRSVFYDRFNSLHPDSISMRSYFDEVSYNQLNIFTYIYPASPFNGNLSYVDAHPRAYYSPYNSVTNPIGYQEDQRTEREHLLLKNAIEAMESQIPDSLNIDGDNDDQVDNICFIIKGQNDAWSDLLWAHKWSLYSYEVNIHGINVGTYTFQPEAQNTVRTLSHEMFHSLGAPDLYHYEHDFSTPVGVWDIMERSAGHMLAWMKYRYANWLPNPQTITAGYHSLNINLTSSSNYYRINSPNNLGEFFIVEYRSNIGGLYESTLPESGLLLYRVNNDYQGNAYEGNEIYVFRYDGTLNNDGNIMDACLNTNPNHNTIGNNTNPIIFFSDGSSANFKISIISMNDQSIDFNLEDVAPAPSIKLISLTNNMSYIKGNLSLKIRKLNSNPISNVKYYRDGELISNSTSGDEYAADIDMNNYEGWHTITATAYNNGTLCSSDSVRINILNSGTYWFDWMDSEISNNNIAPGVVPFSVAVSYNLNNNILYAKKIKMRIDLDPAGTTDAPGAIHAKIVRTDAYGVPLGQVVVNYGSFIAGLDGDYVYNIPENLSSHPLTGLIALQLDLPAYHRVLVDTTGITGYTWRTNSGWAWKNLDSYGIAGSAIMGLQMSNSLLAQDDLNTQPVITDLLGNYPNPFNPVTNIRFSLAKDMKAIIDVYNCKGQLVRSIDAGYLKSGLHHCTFNGLNNQKQKLSSGVYLYKLRDVSAKTAKMLLLK